MKTVTFYTLNNELKCINNFKNIEFLRASSMLTTQITDEVFDIIFYWTSKDSQLMMKIEYYSNKNLFN